MQLELDKKDGKLANHSERDKIQYILNLSKGIKGEIHKENRGKEARKLIRDIEKSLEYKRDFKGVLQNKKMVVVKAALKGAAYGGLGSLIGGAVSNYFFESGTTQTVSQVVENRPTLSSAYTENIGSKGETGAARNAIHKLIEEKMWIVRGKTIGVLGLAFKPNTDDMRSAPSIDIITVLQKEGAKIRAYDPQAAENAKKMLKDVVFANDAYDLAKGCDALLLLTEWSEFKTLDFKKIKKLVKQPLIFDGRNLYHDAGLSQFGFEYYGVGIGKLDS